MPKIFKRYCNTCGKYYESKGKKYCSRKCQPSPMKGKKGHKSWNLGLTKETSEILKKSGEKISISLMGKPSGFKDKKHKQSSKDMMKESWDYDKHFNEEICNKISISAKLVPHTKEWNDKVSESLIGRKLTPEHIRHMTENRIYPTGKDHFLFGTHPSQETRDLMSINNGMKKPEVRARMKGRYVSPETCQKISDSRMGDKNPIFKLTKMNGIGYGAWYYTPIQGYKWLKSSFEIAYAEYLDQHNILWYYEPKTFLMTINIDGKEKETSYTPDFYLPKFNKFIDTKGWFKPESKLKVSKFHEMFSFYLEILFEQDLINLKINLKYYTNNKKSKIINKDEISYESSLEELIKEYIKIKVK